MGQWVNGGSSAISRSRPPPPYGRPTLKFAPGGGCSVSAWGSFCLKIVVESILELNSAGQPGSYRGGGAPNSSVYRNQIVAGPTEYQRLAWPRCHALPCNAGLAMPALAMLA